MTDFSKYIGKSVQLRSGKSVKVAALIPDARPAHQLIIVYPDGSIATRHANGELYGSGSSESDYDLVLPTKKIKMRVFKGVAGTFAYTEADWNSLAGGNGDGKWISEPFEVEVEDE